MTLKYLVVCLAFFFIATSHEEETITWNTAKKLTWQDFKANPDLNSDAAALTASGITFGYSLKTEGRTIIAFSATVEAHFYPSQSWYIKDVSDDRILAHEQLHFDITELHARKFRKQLSTLSVNRNIKKQITKLHNEINQELAKTQRRYDSESNHSINIENQLIWQTFINKELKTLDQYKQ